MSTIHLLPLGTVERRIVSALQAPLRETFRSQVDLCELDVALVNFYDQHRAQYNSTDIIHHILTHYPALAQTDGTVNAPKVLAVLSEDLYIPILTYVFGEAELGGSVAVVSYHRLQNERYGLPPDEALFASRLRKEALHELGHVYGLVHCLSQNCVMHASTYVEDIDFKSASFCDSCTSELLREKRDGAMNSKNAPWRLTKQSG